MLGSQPQTCSFQNGEVNAYCLSHPACGISLQYPEQANTEGHDHPPREILYRSHHCVLFPSSLCSVIENVNPMFVLPVSRSIFEEKTIPSPPN